MSDLEGTFDTPILQYLRLKKSFLQELVEPTAWGQQGTEQRIKAISNLLHTSELTRTQLNTILTSLHILQKLYQEIVWNMVDDIYEPGDANEAVLAN